MNTSTTTQIQLARHSTLKMFMQRFVDLVKKYFMFIQLAQSKLCSSHVYCFLFAPWGGLFQWIIYSEIGHKRGESSRFEQPQNSIQTVILAVVGPRTTA